MTTLDILKIVDTVLKIALIVLGVIKIYENLRKNNL